MNIKTTILILSVLIVSGCNDRYAEKVEHPNIIIIYADDLGYGDLACQNAESKISTPNLDKLASEGMRFTDAHSSSGICTPSRYALLTGRHHWRDFHDIVHAMGAPVFQKNQFTLARLLKDNGYATACVGKWHLGWDWEAIRKKDFVQQDSMLLWKRYTKFWPSEAYDWSKSIPGGPLDRGFDYYFGDGTINFPPYAWIKNDKVVEVPTVTMTTPKGKVLEGGWEVRPGPAVKDWDFFKVLPTLTEKAVEYIISRKKKQQPFFLYMAFPSPHAPIIPNEDFRGMSEAGPYGDFVSQTDWCAGQILNAIEQIGEKENTIVIFSADNGPEHFAYERIANYHHYSSAPFRGVKRDLYEGGHHIPMIVSWPNKIQAMSVSNELISQVDILKTIASLIGAKLPKGLAHDSHDFSQHWLGIGNKQNIRKQAVQNTFENRFALRDGDWLYINHKSGYHSRTPTWINEHFSYPPLICNVQLYNLKEDKAQKINLANEYPDLVEQLQEKLKLALSKETFVEQ